MWTIKIGQRSEMTIITDIITIFTISTLMIISIITNSSDILVIILRGRSR